MHDKSTPTPLRLVGYTRRSKERHNGFGLAAQADAIRRWAEYERAQVIEIIEDDDTSGVVDPMARGGLARALEMLRAGEADALVVAKFDRLARSLVGFVDVLKLVQEEGWQLICLDPQLDLRTAAGRAMGAMLIAFGDIEREAFRDRMQGGRRAKIARGGYAGGQRLHKRYGVQLVAQAEGGYEYEPDPGEQETIGRILELRGAGQTLAAIARTLETEGTAAPAGGSVWSEMTLSRICKAAA